MCDYDDNIVIIKMQEKKVTLKWIVMMIAMCNINVITVVFLHNRKLYIKGDSHSWGEDDSSEYETYTYTIML